MDFSNLASMFGAGGATPPMQFNPLDAAVTAGSSVPVMPTNQLPDAAPVAPNPNSVFGGLPQQQSANDQNNILGMTPANFASMAGGVGAAIAPKDSWQSRLGTFAKGVGTAQLAAIANDNKAKADKREFTTLLDAYPGLAGLMAKHAGQPSMPFNNQPVAPVTGTEQTKVVG